MNETLLMQHMKHHLCHIQNAIHMLMLTNEWMMLMLMQMQVQYASLTLGCYTSSP